jgi:hypothetical protein
LRKQRASSDSPRSCIVPHEVYARRPDVREPSLRSMTTLVPSGRVGSEHPLSPIDSPEPAQWAAYPRYVEPPPPKTNAAVHELVVPSSTGLIIFTPGVMVAPAAGAKGGAAAAGATVPRAASTAAVTASATARQLTTIADSMSPSRSTRSLSRYRVTPVGRGSLRRVPAASGSLGGLPVRAPARVVSPGCATERTCTVGRPGRVRRGPA